MPETQPAVFESDYEEASPWMGHPRWQCTHCAYDSLIEEEVVKHVEKFHRIKCEQCEFLSTDPRDIKDHYARMHDRQVVLTDGYGHEVD